MNTKTSPKNPAQGWHKADIKAALEKAGWSLRKLSIASGYGSPTTLRTVFQRPYPKAERIVADAIGVHPMELWPDRYDSQGNCLFVDRRRKDSKRQRLCDVKDHKTDRQGRAA